MRGQRFFQGVAAAAVLAGLSGAAQAATYLDAQTENHDGNAHMDITSVDVTNDASNISFTVNVRGTIANPNDWGKYLIGLDTIAGGNSNQDDTGNAWGRSISMPGMDFFIGSWVDGTTGAQLFQSTGATTWGQVGGTWTPTLGAQSVTLTTSLASLGLSHGSVINFDVYSSGGNGGDGANDASSNPNQASPNWSDHYHSSVVSTYTVVVPEPAAASLVALGGLAVLARRRRA